MIRHARPGTRSPGVPGLEPGILGAVDHMKRSALEYWDGRYPWGSPETLDRLEASTAEDDRMAAAAIGRLKDTAVGWLEASAPIDWTSAAPRAELATILAEQDPWCDDAVFARIWTYIEWLGWHEGY
jgi:hypothetical protein